jgi:hypothetical protein
MSEHSLDLVVFGAVLALRVVIPLFIPRFPLPAIVLAMLIDAADQTIFQKFTSLDLENYQSYDKALDIFYLAIAYLTTMRNWTNQPAFDTSRFLWYYRLVGVTLFELTHVRALLLIFPNTFEYFFIFYEAVRSRWNPKRLAKRAAIGAAAFIWIFIKLPQEYWIHIAQLDTTDLIKEEIFGVPVDTPMTDIIADNLLFFTGLAVAVVGVALAIRSIARRRLPPGDWSLTFDTDTHGGDVSASQIRLQRASMARKILTIELLEKVALLSMITIIFTRIVPGTPSSPWEQTVGIAVFLVLNTAISGFVVHRAPYSWQWAIGQFVITFLINAGIVLAIRLLLPGDRPFNLGAALFLVLLLSVLIALYDAYRPVYLARFGDDRLEERLRERFGRPAPDVVATVQYDADRARFPRRHTG